MCEDSTLLHALLHDTRHDNDGDDVCVEIDDSMTYSCDELNMCVVCYVGKSSYLMEMWREKMKVLHTSNDDHCVCEDSTPLHDSLHDTSNDVSVDITTHMTCECDEFSMCVVCYAWRHY